MKKRLLLGTVTLLGLSFLNTTSIQASSIGDIEDEINTLTEKLQDSYKDGLENLPLKHENITEDPKEAFKKHCKLDDNFMKKVSNIPHIKLGGGADEEDLSNLLNDLKSVQTSSELPKAGKCWAYYNNDAITPDGTNFYNMVDAFTNITGYEGGSNRQALHKTSIQTPFEKSLAAVPRSLMDHAHAAWKSAKSWWKGSQSS